MRGPRKTPAEFLSRQFRIFAEHKAAGAIALLGATAIALAWANSPWSESYRDLLHAHIEISFADQLGIDKSLRHWINDGLMVVFFFSVGLEIKRELIGGELSSLRKATLPAVAALGGVLAPALIYVAFNAGSPEIRGWGIPMATDIAFALGVLGLLGDRVPVGLKVFLTAVAIVDDIAAIVVIAVFYAGGVAWASLGVAAAAYACALIANRAGARSAALYVVIGGVVWLAFLQSGVHATLAAVLMAFAIPARTRIDGRRVVTRIRELLDELHGHDLEVGERLPSHEEQRLYDRMDDVLDRATSPLVEFEHALVPVITFLVLPLFALANTGISLAVDPASLLDPVALGIVVGLVVGKPLGITVASWLAVRAGIADLPEGVRWRQVLGAGLIAGIGFTMSLFISALAFGGEAELDELAKLAVLSASVIAATAGLLVLRKVTPSD